LTFKTGRTMLLGALVILINWDGAKTVHTSHVVNSTQNSAKCGTNQLGDVISVG
jgi:hypothetical protein